MACKGVNLVTFQLMRETFIPMNARPRDNCRRVFGGACGFQVYNQRRIEAKWLRGLHSVVRRRSK